MISAALPPIALEAVLKLLAIAEENSMSRKVPRVGAKPKLRLELTPPAAPFAAQIRRAAVGTARRTTPRRTAASPKPANARHNAEGSESC